MFLFFFKNKKNHGYRLLVRPRGSSLEEEGEEESVSETDIPSF